MLSIRLPSDLNKQLDILSINTGASKTSHIRKAIIEYLANQGSDINSETLNHSDNRRIDEGLYDAISDIIKMVESGSRWTKKPTTNPEPTPGIYGINKPRGFHVDQEGRLSVISVFLSPTFRPNVSRYQHDLTLYADWKEFMTIIEETP